MSALIELIKNETVKVIDLNQDEFESISSKLWHNPELSSQEHKSHDYITQLLENKGFHVMRRHPLETSFIASFGDSKDGGITVGICCEYDALPDIGHACGHNLIAECSIAVAVAIREALIKHADDGFNGKVVLLGTPAEEVGGGKAEMIKHGVFDQCDFCIMAHPSTYDLPDPIMVAVSQFQVIFKGKPSHAAMAPWNGNNALDAAISCYNNMSMLRQQMHPTSRVHCVIMNGGKISNIIPETSQMSFFVRAVKDDDMIMLKNKVHDCARAAALATGCECEFVEGTLYNALQSNKTLVDLYVNNAQSVGVLFNHTGSKQGGSTDMGNVSTIKPSIHPKFKIVAKGNPHTREFCDAAILKKNQEPTLACAKALAMTAIDVLMNPKLIHKINFDFENNHC